MSSVKPHIALRLVATALLALMIAFATYWLSDLIAGTAISDRPATCIDEGCFCEAVANTFPVQVANAFSSFAFVVLGVWALLSSRAPVRGTRERRLKPMFAITMLFLGMSSFYYHATLSFSGQFLDIFSMYTFGILLLVGALYRSGRISGVLAVLVFIAGSIVAAAIQLWFPDSRRVLFAVLLLPGIVLELTPLVTGHSPLSRQVRLIYVGVALMLVAYAIWLMDQSHLLCDPDSLLQGHALWHVLTAIAGFMVFEHYRRTPHVPR